jgi:hypothetical protein
LILAKLNKFYHIIIPIIVFAVYLITLAPSVIQIDSGELTAVQSSAGIAHPTGYPLFTMTGYLFSRIPLPFPIVYKLNILAAAWCAAAIFMFILTAKLILDNINSFGKSAGAEKQKKNIKNKNRKEKETVQAPEIQIPEIKKTAAVSAGALILAFSKTFWFQSTSVEVYSMQVFLFCLQLYFLIKAFIKKEDDLVSWIIFALSLAAGFANHMTTLLILPGTAYLFFIKHGFNKNSFIKIGKMLAVFFPVLILAYSYLPIRAGQNPAINWGNPVNFENIMHHISGKQYQVWLFSSSAAAKKQLSYFLSNIFSEFNISLFICLFGVLSALMLSKRLFMFLLIVFASTVLYSINYDIADIDSYFLLAYIALSLFAVAGVVKIFEVFKLKKYVYAFPAGLTIGFILLQFYFNIEEVNQSGIYTFEDYTKSLISSTPKNSVILSYQWDYFVSSSYYFQNIEGFRKDAVIIDKELLRRSWYYNQLKRNHPEIYNGIKEEAETFVNAVKPFERDEPYNAAILEGSYQSVMTNIVKSNIGSRSVYIGPELFEAEMQQGNFRLPEGYSIVPDLFLFKVVKGKEYVPAANPDFTIRLPKKRDHYINTIENFIGGMLVRRALYEMQFDNIERAKVYINKIKTDLPDYVMPLGLTDAIRR